MSGFKIPSANRSPPKRPGFNTQGPTAPSQVRTPPTGTPKVNFEVFSTFLIEEHTFRPSVQTNVYPMSLEQDVRGEYQVSYALRSDEKVSGALVPTYRMTEEETKPVYEGSYLWLMKQEGVMRGSLTVDAFKLTEEEKLPSNNIAFRETSALLTQEGLLRQQDRTHTYTPLRQESSVLYFNPPNISGSAVKSSFTTAGATTAANTSTFAVSAGSLVFAAAVFQGGAGQTINSCTGFGAGWTLLGQVDAISALAAMAVFYKHFPLASTGFVTFNKTTGGDVNWAISEYANCATALPIVQVTTKTQIATTAPFTTLGAFASTDNRPVGFFGTVNLTNAATGAGYTLVNPAFSQPASSGFQTLLQSEYSTQPSTSVTWSLTTLAAPGMIAAELKHS